MFLGVVTNHAGWNDMEGSSKAGQVKVHLFLSSICMGLNFIAHAEWYGKQTQAMLAWFNTTNYLTDPLLDAL